MSDATQALFEAALKLPDKEREKLTFILMETLPPPDGWEEVTEEELHAELKRRMDEAERDPSVLIPWEEVKIRIRRDAEDWDESERKSQS